jgi:pimeloyl-ACP methyl ester carboxylesterase
VERSLRQSVSNQTIVTEAMIDRYWELLRYPGNRQATMERFAAPRVPYTTQQLAGLKVPTLVIWGEEDALIPYAAGKLFAQTIPGAKLVAYPGIGHLPHEEAAARSVADLQAFLAAQGVDGTAG